MTAAGATDGAVTTGPQSGRTGIAPDCTAWAGRCADPVFVFCAGRSGSTLLRFILDAHPDLACPPETELPTMCKRLADVWSVFERPADGTALTDAAIAGMRHTLDLMIGPYLNSRGKKRFCDKSIGSAVHAALLVRMYPRARFVCLYRHPMDLIASGLEACPWGLNSYGFEQYIGASPANMVAAIAQYWADYTGAIMAAEQQFPGHCIRVRYEDLVTAPDLVASQIFAFVGVSPAPGISASVFSHDRERFGRSDFKIWNTSRIDTSSVGRGWSVPAPMIPAPLLGTINDLAGRLGYRTVGAEWGTADRPANMLAADGAGAGALAGGQLAEDAAAATARQGTRLLGERLEVGLSRLDDSFSRRWGTLAAERFLIVATTPAGAEDASWLVDLCARTVTPGNGHSHDGPQAAAATWRVAGTADGWRQVVTEGANLGVVFRSGRLRYADSGDAGPGSVVADTRVAMMSELLGCTIWTDDRV
ncbi:MAG: sulfotransferase family protein [Streptosporangiaceae bacterium]